jgi:hypothetical protein
MEFTEETELEYLLRFSSSGHLTKHTLQTQSAPMLNFSETMQNMIAETIVKPYTFQDHTNIESIVYSSEKASKPTKPTRTSQNKIPIVSKPPEPSDSHSKKVSVAKPSVENMFRVKVYYFSTHKFIQFEVQAGTLIKYVMNIAISRLADFFVDRQPKNISKYSFYYAEEASHLPDQDFEIGLNLKIERTSSKEFCLIEKGLDETSEELHSINPEENGYMFKINLHNHEIQIKAEANQSLKNLLQVISDNQHSEDYLNPNLYEFMIKIRNEGNLEEICPLPMDLKLKNLNTTKLILHKKQFLDTEQTETNLTAKRHPSESEDIKQNSNISNMTRSEACRYKEYMVTKINRRGKRQNRVLGIDQLKIYNMSRSQAAEFQPRNKLFTDDTFLGRLKRMMKGLPKRTGMSIEQVQSVKLDIKDPKTFYVTLRKEGELVKTCFIADNRQIAEEIVSKINYIKKLNQL